MIARVTRLLQHTQTHLSKQLGRVLRVDHVEKYRLPKELQDKEDALDDVATDVTNGDAPKPSSTTGTWQPGHAYIGKELKGSHSLSAGVDVWAPQVILLIIHDSMTQTVHAIVPQCSISLLRCLLSTVADDRHCIVAVASSLLARLADLHREHYCCHGSRKHYLSTLLRHI
jgi:hypothetical protein